MIFNYLVNTRLIFVTISTRMPDMGQYIPTSEAAELAGLTADYVRDLCREGRIKSQKFGHVVMVDKDSPVQHIESVKKWREERSREAETATK